MKVGPVVGVALLLMCLAAPASAAGAEFYLLGGMALANLGGDAEAFGDTLAAELESGVGGSWQVNKKSRVGVDFGVGVKVHKSDLVAGALEVRYATRGVKYDLRETSGSGITAKEIFKLNYVEVPVLLELTPPASGSVRPSFVVGPVLAFKASAKATAEAQGQSNTQDFPSGVIKGTVFGGLVGAGMEIMTTPNSNFLVQARFQAGFSNMVDDPNFTLKSRDFSIMAGWSMALPQH